MQWSGKGGAKGKQGKDGKIKEVKRGIRTVTIDFDPTAPHGSSSTHVPKTSVNFHMVPPPTSLVDPAKKNDAQGLSFSADSVNAHNQADGAQRDEEVHMGMQSFDGQDHGAATNHTSTTVQVETRIQALAQTLLELARGPAEDTDLNDTP